MEKPVYCSYQSRGCKKICTLRDLKDHMKICVYGVVSCPLKCGIEVVIKMLPTHMSMECPRRTDNCHFCGDDIPFQSKQNHESNCSLRPTSCNYCNDRLVFFQMEKHHEICMHKPRSCKLDFIGFKIEGNKEQVEKHESVWERHIDLLTKLPNNNSLISGSLQTSNADLTKTVAELSDENTALKKNLDSLSSKFQTILEENSVLKDKINSLESKFSQIFDLIAEKQKSDSLSSQFQKILEGNSISEDKINSVESKVGQTIDEQKYLAVYGIYEPLTGDQYIDRGIINIKDKLFMS